MFFSLTDFFGSGTEDRVRSSIAPGMLKGCFWHIRLRVYLRGHVSEPSDKLLHVLSFCVRTCFLVWKLLPQQVLNYLAGRMYVLPLSCSVHYLKIPHAYPGLHLNELCNTKWKLSVHPQTLVKHEYTFLGRVKLGGFKVSRRRIYTAQHRVFNTRLT